MIPFKIFKSRCQSEQYMVPPCKKLIVPSERHIKKQIIVVQCVKSSDGAEDRMLWGAEKRDT